MKKITEIDLMILETRLDRINAKSRKKKLTTVDQYQINKEARKALGEIRSLMEYHLKNRQKTLKAYMPRKYKNWHQANMLGESLIK